MQRDSNGGHKFPDIDPKWASCMCCKDTGIVGGGDTEFAYCKCISGTAAMLQDPWRVREANETRAKLGLAK
jgi:hypothetical protein